MKSLIQTRDTRSVRVFLIGVELKSRTAADVRESLAELEELATTAGTLIVGEGVQKLAVPVAATYIGPGKAAEFAAQSKANDVDTVIFDDELSPAQTRNLEKIFGCKIMDRTALILEIFGQRARTREGKLQIEHAQLKYLLPRLTRYWSHLSRQRGSTGSIGGEGESQLEADRRKLSERIEKIESELDLVRRQRETQRAGRQRSQWPLASIVGYTNAGKSTLLNRLTGAAVLAEDKLFATLDPTTRRLKLPTNQNVLLTDTVGFIRKLPHQLVESFNATLEEAVMADFLVHLLDASHPRVLEFYGTTMKVLSELGADAKKTLVVFNKIDQVDDPLTRAMLRSHHPEALFISVHTGEGIDQLVEQLGGLVGEGTREILLHLPHDRTDLLARLHREGRVEQTDYEEEFIRIRASVPERFRRTLEPFIIL